MRIFNLIDPLHKPKERVGIAVGKLTFHPEQKLKTHYLIIVSESLMV
jgi:hypothetical protein